jgi:hypothetical protein
MTNTALATTVNHHMTERRATYLLKTVWPEAPDTEVIKAAIICAQYNLNPLLKQVSLVKFNGKEGPSWVAILGIKATRNIALRNGHRWSFIDGPRVMTDAEQTAIFGQVYSDRIYAIVKIREGGDEFPGYGWWPRDKQPYGIDKGNSAVNMAFIRAERNALDKMEPGGLPSLEVADEGMIDTGNLRAAIEAGRHENAVIVEQDTEILWNEAEGLPPDVVITESRLMKLKTTIESKGLKLAADNYLKAHFPTYSRWSYLTNRECDQVEFAIESGEIKQRNTPVAP